MARVLSLDAIISQRALLPLHYPTSGDLLQQHKWTDRHQCFRVLHDWRRREIWEESDKGFVGEPEAVNIEDLRENWHRLWRYGGLGLGPLLKIILLPSVYQDLGVHGVGESKVSSWVPHKVRVEGLLNWEPRIQRLGPGCHPHTRHIHNELWKLIVTSGWQAGHPSQPHKATTSDEVMMALDFVLSFVGKTIHWHHRTGFLRLVGTTHPSSVLMAHFFIYTWEVHKLVPRAAHPEYQCSLETSV